MSIRLRKSDGSIPTRRPAVAGDPPVYRETLRALTARDPFFLVDPKVEHMAWTWTDAPAVTVTAAWSALDAVVEAAREQGVAA